MPRDAKPMGVDALGAAAIEADKANAALGASAMEANKASAAVGASAIEANAAGEVKVPNAPSTAAGTEAPGADVVLALSDVTMQFGGVIALDNVSLEVAKGEIVALIGPNGAGKTTAFNCITGVYEPTNGQISLNGKVVARNHPQGKMKSLYKGQNSAKYSGVTRHTPDEITKRGVARTFQNIRLFGALTVFENVLIAKHMRAKQNVFTAVFRLNAKEERRMRDEAMELLAQQGLAHLKDHVASSLPYGLQRRLEIARALATGPSLLLLDEPAAGMNPKESEDLTWYIREIRDAFGLTVLLIEHHMQVVMNISDRIYVLDYGRTIAHGTPSQIQSDPAVINAYLGEVGDNA